MSRTFYSIYAFSITDVRYVTVFGRSFTEWTPHSSISTFIDLSLPQIHLVNTYNRLHLIGTQIRGIFVPIIQMFQLSIGQNLHKLTFSIQGNCSN